MRIIFMESLMKTRLTLLSTVCSGGLLLGCASSPSLVVAPGASPSVMEVVTESAQASYARGRHWHREQKLDLAQAAYTQALQTDPTHREAHNALAALFAARGDVDRAIVLLRSLADSHPDAAHVFANLGYAYFSRLSQTASLLSASLRWSMRRSRTRRNRHNKHSARKKLQRRVSQGEWWPIFCPFRRACMRCIIGGWRRQLHRCPPARFRCCRRCRRRWW